MIISKRHKKTGLKTKVVSKIADIAREDWNKVFPDVLESYDFFKTLDESSLEQFSFYYIIVYDRKTPVAATACFLMDYSLDTSINGPLRRITNSIKKFKPGLFSIKAFICGMPIGQGRIGVVGCYDSIINVILRRIEQIAKKKRVTIIAFKDFDHTYSEMFNPLRELGFVKFDSLPTTEMNVLFKDFEDYLATLSSASRYDLRRKFRRVDGHVNIDSQIVDRIEEGILKDVYRLYLDTVVNHDMGFENMPLAFFANISKNMPGRTKYFLWRIDGKLVAFLLCLVSDNMLIDYYVGLDYSVAHKYHLYFVKFRDTLNWCITHNIKRYEMGITGYEPKRRLGFDFIPLYLYVKLRNRMLRPVFNLMCQFLRFENFDPVLKEIKRQRVAP